jgi:hypothetical protein
LVPESQEDQKTAPTSFVDSSGKSLKTMAGLKPQEINRSQESGKKEKEVFPPLQVLISLPVVLLRQALPYCWAG